MKEEKSTKIHIVVSKKVKNAVEKYAADNDITPSIFLRGIAAAFLVQKGYLDSVEDAKMGAATNCWVNRFKQMTTAEQLETYAQMGVRAQKARRGRSYERGVIAKMVKENSISAGNNGIAAIINTGNVDNSQKNFPKK